MDLYLSKLIRLFIYPLGFALVVLILAMGILVYPSGWHGSGNAPVIDGSCLIQHDVRIRFQFIARRSETGVDLRPFQKPLNRKSIASMI